MADCEFRTPTRVQARSRVADNPELSTPVKIPASPFLQQIGYGSGTHLVEAQSVLLVFPVADCHSVFQFLID